MSFQAVTWAIEQKAGSPSAKATLWSIANYANESWCAWPSQKTICDESEQSPDAVQRRLPELEGRGLIRRIPLRFAGRKTVDFVILAPSQFFGASLPEIEPLLPRGCSIDPKFVAANSGNAEVEEVPTATPDSNADAAADCGNENYGISDPALPQTLPQLAAHATALERQQEPVMEPIEPERETRAREDERPALRKFLLKWPTAAVDDKARMEKAWNALPIEKCQPCLDGIDPFLAELKKHGRKHVPAGWKYIEELAWELIETTESEAASHVKFDCWSKEWWAVLLLRLERKQLPGFIVKYACEPGKREWATPVNEMPSPARLAEFKGYPSDGPEMAAWRPWFESKRVNLPQWRERIWVFLPSTGPPESETG